jgi:nitric oxide dioxygenase
MTEFQIRLVMQSIECIRPMADQVATLFFSRLSQTSPRCRLHFSADVAQQRRQFMHVLSQAASAAGSPLSLQADMRAIAERHVKYGLSGKDLDAALAAGVCALDHFLGGEFRPEVKHAWLSLYGELIELAWPQLHEDNLAAHMLIFDIRPCSLPDRLWRSAMERLHGFTRRLSSRIT